MGSKQSKPSEQEPQLYAVATPHPTMKWIYPVYAAPIDALPPPEKKGRSSPLAWLGEKSRSRNEIPVVAEHHERVSVPVVAPSTGVNEDGVWYHFHVDAGGAVDYIRPGTTLPNTFPEPASYVPQTFEGSIAPSMSMAGVPYEESYYSYPASPAYQGYHHPRPQRIAHSDAYSMGSAPHPYPRARSVSPVHSRAITPTNLKPRRATTPTPRRSKTPNYEPAPPVPEHIAPVPSTRRSATPFPRAKALPAPSPRRVEGRDYGLEPREYRVEQRDYHAEHRDHRGEYRDPRMMYNSTSGRASRGSRRPSPDEDSTAIESSTPHEESDSVAVKSVQSRPYSPTPSDYASNTHPTLRHTQKYTRHYPSPSTINSQPPSRPDVYA